MLMIIGSKQKFLQIRKTCPRIEFMFSVILSKKLQKVQAFSLKQEKEFI